jgi:hypothetical protein
MEAGWKIEMLSDLQEKGYAVVKDVYGDTECAELEQGFWNTFGRLAGVLKNDPKTWKKIYEFFPNHGMLFQHWKLGHQQQIWNARQHKNVHKVFKTIWGTKDLTVSFDGCSFGLKPEVTKRGWQRKGWLHLDQSPHRSDFECVQGWLTALDVEKGDATLTVLEGSHEYHATFAKHFGLDKDKTFRNDWLKLEEKHIKWFKEQGCVQRFIECPAGSMVLWDSRTVHAGHSPIKGRANPKNRCVVYISMLPQKLLTDRGRKKKQYAALRGRMTTHWAAGHVKLFGKNPRTYGKPLPEFQEPALPLFNLRSAYLAGWKVPSACPLTIVDPVERKAAVEALIASQDAAKAASVAAKKRKRNR